MFKLFAIFVIFLLAGISNPQFAGAAQTVRFNSAGTPPTPFQIKRAKAKGEVAKARIGDEILGTLHLPVGSGPFPAVVLSHDCRGALPFLRQWATLLADNGIAALIVDSYSTRSLDDMCNNIYHARVQSSDAYGALAYLSSLDQIDAGRLALIGWGQSPVTIVMEQGGVERFFDIKFRAAIGLYVYCSNFSEGKVYAPTLLIVAGKDNWVKSGRCAKSVKAGQAIGSPISMVKYPDAMHSFDDIETGTETILDVINPYKSPSFGATLGYNRSAHVSAQRLVLDFFSEHLSVR